MPDIRIHLHTQGGDVHPVEAPLDMRTAEFLQELIAGLDLPRVDAEGHQPSWTIDNKDPGKTLDLQSWLEENGVREDIISISVGKWSLVFRSWAETRMLLQ